MTKKCMHHHTVFVVAWRCFLIIVINKRPQTKCPPTFEMPVCGEYIYYIYIFKKKLSEEMADPPPHL